MPDDRHRRRPHRKQSEFISLSPKAAFRVKKWFSLFGLGDTDNVVTDEETDELTEPDLVGVRVVFEVRADAKAPGGVRTEIIEVLDDMSSANPSVAAPAAQAKAVAPSAPAVSTARERRQLR